MAPDADSVHDFLDHPWSAETALASLADPIRRWFLQRFEHPTAAQRLAWPAVAAGSNLLLASPTGSGKTLAVFLPLLGKLFVRGEAGCGTLRGLYVAPLKALIADVRRTLKSALRAVRPFCTADLPRLRIVQRTGDTPDRHRRLLRRHPPDILLTTPESLAVLLSQPWSAGLFAGLQWIVIDEVHALAAGKRGADLALSMERLETLAPASLQRIGLSATVEPLSVAADCLAGAGRRCGIARVGFSSPLQVAVEPLEVRGRGFLHTLIDRVEPELSPRGTTLIFTNVRSLAERLTWMLRRRFPHWADQIAVHHSSLSAVRRRIVERRLKQGSLRIVVSSASLELGIDVGSVDAVVLVHPPGGAVRLLQRVGRSGHGPGRVRRGRVFTFGAAELLEAAVTGASSQSDQLEPLAVPEAPLDVLCQQLAGMAAQSSWEPDEAFALVRRAYPYRNLDRRDFDDCLAYLSGRDQAGRDWLPPRLAWDAGLFHINDQRTARLVRRNIGTIVAEEQRPVLRIDPDRAVPEPIGQIDDAFADRLQPGDRFLLDGRCLEFCESDGRSLLVKEASGRPAVPRWQGNGWPLAADLAARLYLLRIRAADALREGSDSLAALLRDDYQLGDSACRSLAELFERQESVSEVPDSSLCLIEVVGQVHGVEYYVHTPLNRAGNDVLARIAVGRLTRDRGRRASSLVADLGFLVCCPGLELGPGDFRQLLDREGFETDLEEAIAASGALRERFQSAATTGLMVLRNPLGRRRRVGGRHWAGRCLFDQVVEHDPDFVLLRQARREMQASVLDVPAARNWLDALPGKIVRCRHLVAPSPLASSWTQPAIGPVEEMDTRQDVLQRLHAELMGQG